MPVRPGRGRRHDQQLQLRALLPPREQLVLGREIRRRPHPADRRRDDEAHHRVPAGDRHAARGAVGTEEPWRAGSFLLSFFSPFRRDESRSRHDPPPWRAEERKLTQHAGTT